MLIATWIVTFVIIVGIGVWSGTKIKSANQWSGGDKTMGPLTLGCVFAAWQIGGMAVVGRLRTATPWASPGPGTPSPAPSTSSRWPCSPS